MQYIVVISSVLFYNSKEHYLLNCILFDSQNHNYQNCVLKNLTNQRNLPLNKNLKNARIEKNMSQAELAALADVTRQTIGLIESGNFNPSLHLCIRICNVLGKTLDQLFWEDKNV